MRRFLSLTVLLALCLQSRAQESSPTTRVAAASVEARFEALEKERLLAEDDHVARLRAATTDDERQVIRTGWEKLRSETFLCGFVELARAAADNPIEARILLRVLDFGRTTASAKEAVGDALARFLEIDPNTRELESAAETVRFVTWLLGSQVVDSFLRKLHDRAGLPATRAAALFHRAALQVEFKDLEKLDRDAARALFQRVVDAYASTDYARDAVAYLYELDHLQCGMPLPAIPSTKDADGNAVDLTSYRGRALVIVFWGIWDPESHPLVAELVDLESRLRDEGLSVLGVNSDKQPEKLATAIRRAGIGFRQVLEGGRDGPWAKAWNVFAWPTVYVVDRGGVISGKHVRGESLARAVQRALAVPAPESRPSPGR